MVRIRLRRVGAKGQPYYRVVVADQRSPRDGRFIEIIGHYNPRVEPSEIVINKDKALAWIANGARPSESVASLLKRAGITTQAPAAETAAAPAAETTPAPAVETAAAPVEASAAPAVEATPVPVVPSEASAEAAAAPAAAAPARGRKKATAAKAE